MNKRELSIWDQQFVRVYPLKEQSEQNDPRGIYMCLSEKARNGERKAEFFIRDGETTYPNEPFLIATHLELERIGWARVFKNCIFSLQQEETVVIERTIEEKYEEAEKRGLIFKEGFCYDELIQLVQEKIKKRRNEHWPVEGGFILVDTNTFNAILQASKLELEECENVSLDALKKQLRRCGVLQQGRPLRRRRDLDKVNGVRHYAFWIGEE